MFQAMKGVPFIEGFPDMENWIGDMKRLMTIGDLKSEMDKRVTKLFTKGSHHNILSVMYLVKNLEKQGAENDFEKPLYNLI